MARDIELDDPWYPAVVLSVGDNDARIGIEGVEEDEDGHFITARDVTVGAQAQRRWLARAQGAGGR